MNGTNGYIDQNTAKRLLAKWKPMLDYSSDKVRPIENEHTRLATVIVLENQQKYLGEANTASGGVFGANATGSTAGNVPGGSDFYANGDARLPKVLIPMIRRTFPELITNEIVGVQPMSGPVGLAFALRYRQGTTALGYDGSGTASDSFNSNSTAQTWWPATTGQTANQSTNAEVGWNYLNNAFTGRVSPTLSAQNFSTSADLPLHPDDYGVAQLLGAFEATSRIPTMEISFEKTAVEAGTRRLAAKWSVELEQDVKNMNGIDLDSELTNTMSYEIQAEIDREMIVRMIRTCLAAGSYSSGGTGYSFWSAASADGRWLGERTRDFYAKVIVEANRVAIRNRRGPANFIIATPRVCAMLEMLPEFKWMPVNGNVNTQPTGIAKVGSVGGRFNVYRDTRTEAQWKGVTPGAYRQNPVEYALLGYKGPEFYDTGIVYCPYIPVMIQRTIGPNDFSPRVGLMTRYGVVDNLFGANLYYHMIIVSGLGTGFDITSNRVYL